MGMHVFDDEKPYAGRVFDVHYLSSREGEKISFRYEYEWNSKLVHGEFIGSIDERELAGTWIERLGRKSWRGDAQFTLTDTIDCFVGSWTMDGLCTMTTRRDGYRWFVDLNSATCCGN